jgi:hypothetical protein
MPNTGTYRICMSDTGSPAFQAYSNLNLVLKFYSGIHYNKIICSVIAVKLIIHYIKNVNNLII